MGTHPTTSCCIFLRHTASRFSHMPLKLCMLQIVMRKGSSELRTTPSFGRFLTTDGRSPLRLCKLSSADLRGNNSLKRNNPVSKTVYCGLREMLLSVRFLHYLSDNLWYLLLCILVHCTLNCSTLHVWIQTFHYYVNIIELSYTVSTETQLPVTLRIHLTFLPWIRNPDFWPSRLMISNFIFQCCFNQQYMYDIGVHYETCMVIWIM